MNCLFFKKFIKTIMLTTPFMVMTMMVLALWGVGGKATYTDLNSTKQQAEFAAAEAKNYMVKGNGKLPAIDLDKPELVVEEEQVPVPAPKKEMQPEKIKWELVV